MINQEVLLNDLTLLAKNFYKVIEVNLDEDTYFEVKTDDSEPKVYNSVRRWVQRFIEAKGVHEDDIDRFREFFEKLTFETNTDKWQRCYYRRWILGEWRMVCMEAIPFDNYSKDDAIVLIVVRDVEDYITDYRSQIR